MVEPTKHATATRFIGAVTRPVSVVTAAPPVRFNEPSDSHPGTSTSSGSKCCSVGFRQPVGAHQAGERKAGQHEAHRPTAIVRLQCTGDEWRHGATSNTGNVEGQRRSAVSVARREEFGEERRNRSKTDAGSGVHA